ncbi:tetratricopeptide repeat protein [Streptomyces sp. NBC_01498]|uniref:tetratricopeptide repeat protein n=1 Tax=Streptomyces sp. NBC_01498 TaxID=2975870 RepID=UPI002E7C52DC|nr:tetratricopeptide repeat protein [Streptomyces sp. NBC_01498]WTL23484.1 tetratricopeptide repeat protein [Streptomyces sp. NBC_01498]
MDRLTVPALAGALGRADETARRTLAGLAPGESLPRGPWDTATASALAGSLLAEADARPELAEALRLWLTLMTPAGPSVSAANSIAGGASIDGTAIQAGEIHGGVHVHTGERRPAPPVPRQLIPGPAHFTNRLSDLGALESLRSAHPGASALTVVVTGAAGVGKTALVSRWLHGLTADYPDGQLYADLRGHSKDGPVGPGAVLGQFLRAFGLDQVPAAAAEQAALWRTVTTGLRIAVHLDNALSAAQIRPLLPSAATALTVVTSRNQLPGLGVDGAAFHHLGILDPASAVELLTRRLGDERVARERETAHQLARLCAGLPLALCVAGARMAARPRQSLTAMTRAMSREGGRLAALDAGGEQAVERALDGSYEVLSDETARGYRQLGLPPVAEFPAAVAAAACALSVERADRLLDELIEVNLVEELGPDRYRFHDLVRLHAAQLAAARDTPEACESVLRRVADWYVASATAAEALLSPSRRRLRRDYARTPVAVRRFADPSAALAWLDTERLHLMDLLRTAVDRGWHATAWQIVDGMQPLFLRTRPYDLWVEAHRLGLAAAERAGHPEAVSRMLTTGGSGLYNSGSHDEAIGWFTQALEGARRDGNRRTQAQALHGLGQSHRLAGRLGTATTLFTEALGLREEIGYVRGAALSRLCLGDIALASGESGKAVALLTRARADLRAVPDPYDAARALAFLGRAHAAPATRDFATAERLLGLALSEFADTGSVHWQGRVLEMLGETAQERGDTQRARDWYEQSLARYAPVSPTDAARLEERLRAPDPL